MQVIQAVMARFALLVLLELTNQQLEVALVLHVQLIRTVHLEAPL
jgi:hypothetical protein